MLVIRLARGGRKKYPVYRIVAADKHRAATGKFVAVLGHYNPHTKDLVIKKDELQKHIDNGAQPSNAVLKLMKQEKIDLPKWAEIKTRDRKPKKEPEVQPAEATAEVATEVAEATEAKATDAPPEQTPAEEQKVAEVVSEQAESKQAEADKVDDASGTVKEADRAEVNKDKQDDVAEAAIEEAQS